MHSDDSDMRISSHETRANMHKTVNNAETNDLAQDNRTPARYAGDRTHDDNMRRATDAAIFDAKLSNFCGRTNLWELFKAALCWDLGPDLPVVSTGPRLRFVIPDDIDATIISPNPHAQPISPSQANLDALQAISCEDAE